VRIGKERVRNIFTYNRKKKKSFESQEEKTKNKGEEPRGEDFL